ncbi:DUF2147 domain-containing protein [bacterium]|nr:DUF2147 domain-containing protein [bacterium]MBU1071914.1 DUF2147 domain-containing protein [bacterium]MBU1675691.1 DUF2147 domain-containing protein [bacterium]
MAPHRLLLTASLALLAAAAAPANDLPTAPDDILGVWETAHDDESWSRIEIYKRDGRYHGRIVYLSSPVYPDDGSDGPPGQPRMDLNNPDESLRKRPIQGLRLMRNFRHDDGDGKWKDGRIYDPKSGNTYRCKLTLKGPDTLEVFGYKKVGFVKLGRDTAWTRHRE